MHFELDGALAILARPPATLAALLQGLARDWTRADEGPETRSPYDVVGHLIHGERTDWVPRVEVILRGEARPFERFDSVRPVPGQRPPGPGGAERRPASTGIP